MKTIDRLCNLRKTNEPLSTTKCKLNLPVLLATALQYLTTNSYQPCHFPYECYPKNLFGKNPAVLFMCLNPFNIFSSISLEIKVFGRNLKECFSMKKSFHVVFKDSYASSLLQIVVFLKRKRSIILKSVLKLFM